MATAKQVAAAASHVAPSGWRRLGWERLLLERGWLQRSASEKTEALQQLSRQLSFPLTLAHAWPALGLHTASERPLEICVLGAREEADAVPMTAWMELCVLADAPRVALSMIGPEAAGRARSLQTDAHCITQRVCPTTFTESALGRALLAGAEPDLPDAFVLFNPGLHAGKYAWRPSIEAVLATEKPLLVTAYSDQDAASDAQWLAELHGEISYVENPWASLEPWGGGDARANKYLAVLHGGGSADAMGDSALPQRAPRAPVVPVEQGWLRRSAMADFFGEGPRMLRRTLGQMWSERDR